MVFLLKKIRQAGAWVGLAVVAGVIGAIVAEPVSNYLKEAGYLQHPHSAVGLIMVALHNLYAASWFPWCAGLSLGLMVMFALNKTIRIMERKNFVNVIPIDNVSLAAEARSLSSKVSMLLAEASENSVIARNDDMNRTREGKHDLWDSHARIEGRAVRVFHQDHNSEFRRILATAQKCISLNWGEMWHISHGLRYYSDIQRVPAILEKIAVDLTHPQADIPMVRNLPPGVVTSLPAASLPSQAPPLSPAGTSLQTFP